MMTLDEIEAQINAANLPPVHQWNPTVQGTMDLVIRRDGSWWHEGSQIKRESLVRLFARILRLEPDGSYCLVTPAEKLTIDVQLAPFLAVELDIFGQGREQQLAFRTNVDERVIAAADTPLTVTDDNSGHPQPLLSVRSGLQALLTRSVYYQVVNCAIEQDGQFGVWSGGAFHVLGASDSDDD